jgi:hypothetical protein
MEDGEDTARMAMIHSTALISGYNHFYLIGDSIVDPVNLHEFYYADEKARTVQIAYSGVLSVSDNLTSKWFIPFPVRIFGFDVRVGEAIAPTTTVRLSVAGTALTQTYDVYEEMLGCSITRIDGNRNSGKVTGDVTVIDGDPSTVLYLTLFFYSRYQFMIK